jgi:hypothetical protein
VQKEEKVTTSSSFEPERKSENDLGYLKLYDNRIAAQHPTHLRHVG